MIRLSRLIIVGHVSGVAYRQQTMGMIRVLGLFPMSRRLVVVMALVRDTGNYEKANTRQNRY